MKNIVSKRNNDVISKGEKLLVGYLLAGYPEKWDFLRLASNCEAAGIDIFEIGFPSENPSSDGEVIRNAHKKVDFSICSDIDYWKAIRETISKPIWLMGYKRDLIFTGFYKLLAQKKLIDAFVIPDLSLQEREELSLELSNYGVDVLGLVNPEMQEDELEKCFSGTALIYQQLYAGPTGMSIISDDYNDILSKAHKYKHTKVFAGFGISTPQRVSKLLSGGFDGVVVGTAMIKKLNESEQELIEFIKELAASTKKAGEGNEVHSDL